MNKRAAVILSILLVGLFASGCAFESPKVTPATTLLATARPKVAITVPLTPAMVTITPGQPTEDASNMAEMSVQDLAPAAPSAPVHPTIEETLNAGLTYVQAGFKLKLPPAESFASAQAPDLSSVEIEQALASGPWLVAIGPMQVNEDGLGVRTIIISNNSGKETMRWWGEVDENGVASTIVFTGMPRPDSVAVKGAVGKIISLPPGSAYERFFESEDGRRFGIASNKEVISELLEKMTEKDGWMQVWGELRFAVNDYNGRRILVRNYDLKDADPEEILARPSPGEASLTPISTPNASLGPLAIVYEPKTRAVIHGQAQVIGEVDNPVSDYVIVRVENEDGQTLGETQAILGPQREGVAQFAAVTPFADPSGVGDGRIAVYAPAPASGQLQLLGWQEVRFAGDVGDKRVTILQPEAGTAIRGNIQVKGRAENIPTETLLVRIEDTAGDVFGQAKARINHKGSWQTVIRFRRPRTVRPGVIAVYYVRPDGGVLTLLATMPVKLKR